ncbi:hypothetical protein V1264_020354 [Littorina saxatilis]|uniref:Uncharacterized protein n=1 Tax=Littorina saxatilis TaxID=31220 RepID=A0AAN9B9U6_9CAEN
MPAGVTWGTYLKFMTAAMLSMFAGAQTVHVFFKPLDDMAEWVEREKVRLRQEESATSSEKT